MKAVKQLRCCNCVHRTTVLDASFTYAFLNILSVDIRRCQ